MGGRSWGDGDGSGSDEYNQQWRMLVTEAWGSTAAGMQPSAARVHLGEGCAACGHVCMQHTRPQAASVMGQYWPARPTAGGAGGACGSTGPACGLELLIAAWVTGLALLQAIIMMVKQQMQCTIRDSGMRI